MKCVPLEECGGGRNYVGHYHLNDYHVRASIARRKCQVSLGHMHIGFEPGAGRRPTSKSDEFRDANVIVIEPHSTLSKPYTQTEV